MAATARANAIDDCNCALMGETRHTPRKIKSRDRPRPEERGRSPSVSKDEGAQDTGGASRSMRYPTSSFETRAFGALLRMRSNLERPAATQCDRIRPALRLA